LEAILAEVADDATTTDIHGVRDRLPAALDGGRLAVAPSLATGAATSSEQATGNASMASLDAKTPLPTVSGESRVASKLTLTSVVHDPNSLISLGGTAVTHRRCDVDLTGGGTVEYLPARRAIRFAVDGTSGQWVTYRQRMWNPYVSGASIRLTFASPFSAAQANQEKRVGLFDDDDGIFLLQTASAVSFGIRSSVSGSLVETITPIPGLDPTLDHICQIAYQWPAGRVEFWVDGARLLNLDKSGGAVPWMGKPSLPFTVEVRNVGASVAGHIDVHHFNVVLEGAERLQENEVTIRATTTSIPTGGKMMIQGRVAQDVDLGTILNLDNRGVYVPKRVRVSTTNGPMVVRVFANGTVSGTPSWTPATDDAGIEYDTAAVFAGATGVFVGSSTIDTTTGSCEIDLGNPNIEAFTATSGAFLGAEVVQVVGYARSGTVGSADVDVTAVRLA
jgi:hypothetical protein